MAEKFTNFSRIESIIRVFIFYYIVSVHTCYVGFIIILYILLSVNYSILPNYS